MKFRDEYYKCAKFEGCSSINKGCRPPLHFVTLALLRFTTSLGSIAIARSIAPFGRPCVRFAHCVPSVLRGYYGRPVPPPSAFENFGGRGRVSRDPRPLGFSFFVFFFSFFCFFFFVYVFCFCFCFFFCFCFVLFWVCFVIVFGDVLLLFLVMFCYCFW